MEVAKGSARRMVRSAAAAVVALALAIPPTVGSATASNATAAPKGGSRVGVARKVIKLGMHAPLTGAVPVPSNAIDRAKDIYFRWLRSTGRRINGRNVRVILKNDNYNPSQATAVCKEMVREDKVFALVGFVGMEQIQACAKFAASAHVPYLAPGSAERGMDLAQTFATTMTWPDQGPLMADFTVSKLKGRKRENAVVWYGTSNLMGAHNRFVRSMERRKADVYSRTVPTQANAADATTVVAELQTRGVDNVFVLVSPIFFLQMQNAASNRDYHPRWTGLDPAYQVDSIANSTCSNDQPGRKVKFFSPYPALADRDRFDKRFDRAVARFYPRETGDEIMWGNWAQQKVIARLLRKPGRNLTRKRFVYFAERARKLVTGVGPRLDFRPKDHYGARQVHLNQVDCDSRKWRTKKAFVNDF